MSQKQKTNHDRLLKTISASQLLQVRFLPFLFEFGSKMPYGKLLFRVALHKNFLALLFLQ